MLVDKFFEKYKKPNVSYSEFKAKHENDLYKFKNNKKINKYTKLKLCIGVLIIIFTFSLGFMLKGGNKNEKINVNFIVEGESYLVKLDKGTSISKEIIPLTNKDLVVELYYDEDMENEYNFENIERDTLIYMKIIEKIIVEFIIDGVTYIVEINKGTSISREIIPLTNDGIIVELYYDEKMENKYNNELLNEDIKIYGKKSVNNQNNKVSITFIFNDAVEIVFIDKGSLITSDIIPFNLENKVLKLYYDNDYTHEYNGEQISKSINIYIKLIDEQITNMVDEVCDAFFNKFIKPKRKEAVIEDVIIFEYLGIYNGVFVGVFLDKKDCFFIERECQIIVEDLVFKYSYGYNIYVYDGTSFMDLLTAYNSSKLSYENLLIIYRLHYKMGN